MARVAGSEVARGTRRLGRRLLEHLPGRLSTLVAAVLGFLASPVIESLVQPLVSSENLSVALYFLFGSAAIVGMLQFQQIVSYQRDSSATSRRILDLVGQHAKLLPFDEAYQQLAKWADGAQDEILLLTNYFDQPGSSRASIAPARRESSARVAWFDSAIRAIRRAQHGRDLRFFRVVQIDVGRRPNDEDLAWVYERLHADDQQKRLTEALLDASGDRTDQVFLKVAALQVPHTFLLIDKKHFWMNLDTWDTKEGVFNSKLVLTATDETGEQFRSLRDLFFRLCHSNECALLQQSAGGA